MFATIPLIHQLMESSAVSQAWFADNATAGGRLCSLRQWWDELERVGPEYGYYVNSAKSWLMEGHKNLGAALGLDPSLRSAYSCKCGSGWMK